MVEYTTLAALCYLPFICLLVYLSSGGWIWLSFIWSWGGSSYVQPWVTFPGNQRAREPMSSQLSVTEGIEPAPCYHVKAIFLFIFFSVMSHWQILRPVQEDAMCICRSWSAGYHITPLSLLSSLNVSPKPMHSLLFSPTGPTLPCGHWGSEVCSYFSWIRHVREMIAAPELPSEFHYPQ